MATAVPGEVYGRLTVIHDSGTRSKHNGRIWVCRCECGSETLAAWWALKRGDKKSCGCLRKELMTSGGKSQHHLSTVWHNMKYRCNDPRSADYYNYGGRGIAICEEWSDFKVFYRWAIRRWRQGLTLDRKDNDGPYSPDNCRFITRKQQSANRRNTAHDGKKRRHVAWAFLGRTSV